MNKTMKVCYASVYRDGTGYAHAAIANIRAMVQAGIDVVTRPITLTGETGREEALSIEVLEQKDLQNVTAVVQHCLPHTFERLAGIKNIGVFSWETTNFSRSTWADHCNMMDEVWVSSLQSKAAARRSGVVTPIYIIPHAIDLQRFENRTDRLELPIREDVLVFYTIGENVRRKNLVGLLRAYFAAFSGDDRVALVIKTSMSGQSPEQTEEHVRGMVLEIKRSMHIYPDESMYPTVLIITKRLQDDVLDRLHRRCNVFVSMSHGEAWCLPAAHAMACGNPVIAPNWGSFPELLSEQAKDYWRDSIQQFQYQGSVRGGWLVSGQLMPCFCPDSGFPVLYTGHEQWFDPNLSHAVSIMQEAYDGWSTTGSLIDKGRGASLRASLLGLNTVGEIIRKRLEE